MCRHYPVIHTNERAPPPRSNMISPTSEGYVEGNEIGQ